ncbi:Ig domain-containing protein [Gilliamella apis]|uniref:Ig domain-containing protein n=1 Tax=Gilliamella apis TaxID=1970738 RepID=UPI0021AC5081|nr:Ig domain-containing protein [Gilliamella apis]WLS93598.1 Ig domain-containing protein [Gilliamella apis]
MATTINNDLIIYNDLAQTAFLERRQDNLEVFNTASNGAILIDNELIEGDFRKRAFYKVGGTIESRDVNSTNKKQGKKIGAGETVSVKVPWAYGPYETTEEAFKRRGRDVSEFSEVVGIDVADATTEGYVKYAIHSLIAAIESNPSMITTADIATDGKKTLTKGLRKYGDKFERVSLFVMHSTTYFEIIDQAISNKIHEEAGVVVYGGQPGTLGKPVLVTDCVPVDAILGLVANAVKITESQAPGFRSYDVNDQENLVIAYRAEGTVNIDLLGYSWDTSKGDNPDLAKLSDKENWKKHFDSDKSTAGVLIKLEAPTLNRKAGKATKAEKDGEDGETKKDNGQE